MHCGERIVMTSVTLPDKKFFHPSEVAELLEEPVQNIYRWIRQGRIRTVRPGWRVKIPHEEVKRLLGAAECHQ